MDNTRSAKDLAKEISRANVARIGVDAYLSPNPTPALTIAAPNTGSRRTWTPGKGMRMTATDIAILQYTLRFSLLRPVHLIGFLGISKDTVWKRLRWLEHLGHVKKMNVPLNLRPHNNATETYPEIVSAYYVTASGAALCGEWEVAGTFARSSTGSRIEIPELTVTGEDGKKRYTWERKTATLAHPAAPSVSMAAHTFGVADTAVWFHRNGFLIASEREIKSVDMELPDGMQNKNVDRLYWPYDWCLSKDALGQAGDSTATVHPPDLGVVEPGPDGMRWAIEIERAVKSIAEYRVLIDAYANSNLAVMWLAKSQATRRRIEQAAFQARATIKWAPHTSSYLTTAPDADEQMRIAGFLPGVVTNERPRTWVTADGLPVGLPTNPPPGWGLHPHVAFLSNEELSAPLSYRRSASASGRTQAA